MNIDFGDLSKEQQEDLLSRAEEMGYSKEEIIEAFNENAGDSDNVLDFFDDDDFLEQMLRNDLSLFNEYLDYIIDKIS